MARIFIKLSMTCLLFVITTSVMNGQGSGTCHVLIPEISGSYEGECKKGLADGMGKATGVDQYEGEFKKGYPNGKGKYTWKNGDNYEGEWKKGVRDGYGLMTINMEPKDSIITGYWLENTFVGQEKFPYKVNQKSINIVNIRFSRLGQEKNQIEVVFNENSKPVPVFGFNVTELIGHYANITKTDFSKTLNSIIFPFRGEVNADSYYFDFTINQNGMWRITIDVATKK
ncbi:MAG: hypothetical protein ABFD10_04500 [Prolixibacteraceae bacterium]